MRAFALATLIAALLGLTGTAQPPEKQDKSKQPPAAQPPDKEKDKAAAKGVKTVVTVTVPREKDELMIEKEAMKTTGTTREFETPDLEAGKKFEYTFTLKTTPNNYTTITRVKTVSFVAGEPLSVDLTKAQPDDKAVIRFVPTPDDVVAEMLKLAKVGKDDVVYDLGCGDGRLVIAGVKAGAKKGIGIDIDPERVKESKAAAEKAGVKDKVEIRQGDVLDIKDLSDATVVLIYMSDELGALLKPKLLATLKPGTRVVSHRFTLGDWKPDQTIKVTGKEDNEEYTLHLWTVKEKK